MKNVIRNLSLGLALMGVLTFYACDDEDPTPVPVELSFSSAAVSIGENEGQVDVTIDFSRAAEVATSFQVNVGGTAEYGTDYTTTPAVVGGSANISVAVGETSKTVSITPIDNNEVEGNKTVTFALSTMEQGVELGATTQLEVTIVEDDKPIVTIATLGFEEIDVNEGGSWEKPYRAQFFDRDIFNVNQMAMDDEDGQGRRLEESDSLRAKMSIQSYRPKAGQNDLGFDTYWFNVYNSDQDSPFGWSRFGVMTETDERDIYPDSSFVRQTFHDGFSPWNPDAYGGQGAFTLYPDHDGEQAFRMSHIGAKLRLVIDPVDLSNYENVSVSFTLTTFRWEGFGTPEEGDEGKTVILDIFGAANVPTDIPQETKNGTNVLGNFDRVSFLKREGAAMVPDGNVYSADAPAPNSEAAFLVEELSYEISTGFATLYNDKDLNNISLVIDYQCPRKEPLAIYIDKIEFRGSEK